MQQQKKQKEAKDELKVAIGLTQVFNSKLEERNGENKRFNIKANDNATKEESKEEKRK